MEGIASPQKDLTRPVTKPDHLLGTHRHEKSKQQKRNKKIAKQSEAKNNKPSKKRPNYFIGIQIINPAILGKILAMQNFIKLLDPRFTKSIVPVSTTHVTLAVLYLEDQSCVSKAAELLESTHDQIRDILQSNDLEIHLEKMGHFNNEVLFVNISPGEQLDRLKEISKSLVDCCAEYCNDAKAFKPHVTVMKLSKLHGPRKKKMRKIPPYLYSDMNDVSFGAERATNLQLLSMMKKKQANGYYHCEYTMNFGPGNKKRDEDDLWSLNHWAECIAVACITSALYLSNPNVLRRFANYHSEQIVQDGIKLCNKTEVLKQSKKNEKMRRKLANMKQVLAKEDTKKLIREELGLT